MPDKNDAQMAAPDGLATLELWFFRELSGEQRSSLIRLAMGQKIADECGEVYSHQRKALRRILASLSASNVMRDAPEK